MIKVNTEENRRIIANQLYARRDELFSSIETRLKKTICGMEPSKTLSFVLVRNGFKKNVPFSTEKTSVYVKVLFCFLRGREYIDYNNSLYKIESSITSPILKEIESAFCDFYSTTKTKNIILNIVSKNTTTTSVIQIESYAASSITKNSILKIQKKFRNEIGLKLLSFSLFDIKKKIKELLIAQFSAIMHTSIMHHIAATIGSILSFVATKAVIHNVSIILAKSISLTAIKSALLHLIEHIGVHSIAKFAIGQSLLAAFGSLLGAGANAVAFIVFIPIVLALGYYQYQTFPDTLARKVPKEIIKDLQKNFQNINYQIVQRILEEIDKHNQRKVEKQKKYALAFLIAIILLCIIAFLVYVL